MNKVLSVANVSGFFGDRLTAAREVLDGADVDVLTGDWLAELTLLILHKRRQRDPAGGYAGTFVAQMEDVLGTCLDRGVRVVSNAGGLDPHGCAAAVEELAERLGLAVTVGVVTGDDLAARAEALADAGLLRDARTGEPLVLAGAPLTANAYLGSAAIAACLGAGADVVVTGRVTDAALVVGPCRWRFGWEEDDWDALAGAVVAGHILECGAQATGGNYAFFEEVVGLERAGFPIAEVAADGTAVIAKPAGSGGQVSTGTVTAQLLYEIAGPRYLTPDVTARFDTVRLDQDGPDRVRVSGVRGEPPPENLKVAVTLVGGFRNQVLVGVAGRDVERKAEVARRTILDQLGDAVGAIDELRVELLGRPRAGGASYEEATCILRVAARGSDPAAVGRRFSQAVVATGLASFPGLFLLAPPQDAMPYGRYVAALVPASEVTATATVGDFRQELAPSGPPMLRPGAAIAVDDPTGGGEGKAAQGEGESVRRPLGDALGARSGDKGGDANLGVWARLPSGFPWLDRWLTVERLRALLPELDGVEVHRHRFPNLGALNFVLEGFLGDGVASCLRADGQAKALGEYLRAVEADIPLAALPPHPRS